jgi:uncharacterized membrane protein
MVAGAWALWASLAQRQGIQDGTRWARLLLGLALIPCGLAHLAYRKETAEYVPAWLPWHTGWAVATGFAFFAAAAAIVANRYAERAAALVTLMMAGFTVLVWVPAVMASPGDRFPWTALLVSALITSASGLVAVSYAQPMGRTSRNALD